MNQNKHGMIYVIEGIDSSGKSTLCDMLKEKLNGERLNVVTYHFPGKDINTLGKVVYDIHHSKITFPKKIPNLSLQVLHVAAHIDLWLNYINDSINKREIIILDRFWWSTYAYGKLSNIDTQTLMNLISVEKTCYDDNDVRLYFYVIRESSMNHNINLNDNYLELAEMYEHKSKTYIVNNNSDISVVFDFIYEKIHNDILSELSPLENKNI